MSAQRQAEACLAVSQVVYRASMLYAGSEKVCSPLVLSQWSVLKPVASAPSDFSLPFLSVLSLSLPESSPASSHSDFWNGMKEFLSV